MKRSLVIFAADAATEAEVAPKCEFRALLPCLRTLEERYDDDLQWLSKARWVHLPDAS